MLKLRESFFHSERGDTIVEVLISIAVISLILGGAYVTTNKSLLATRGAQERSNATKLAEAQVEQLKAVIATSPDSVFGGGAANPFCIYQNPASGALQVLPTTSPNCRVTVAGVPTTGEPGFNLSISHPTVTSSDFTIRATWANVGGKVTDQLQIKYRVYR